MTTRRRVAQTMIGTAIAAATLVTGGAAAAQAGAAQTATPAAAAPTAGGGTLTGPTPQVYPPFDDPAGDPCPFALHGVFPVNHVVAFTYTNAKGRVTSVHYTGKLIMRVTRVDTGKSLRVDISGDGVQLFAKDGSSVLYGIGPFASTQHPGDDPGSELAVLHGASALQIAADGHKTILYSSRVENLCTKLA